MRLDRSEHMEGSTWWGIMHYAGKLLCRENSQQATYQPSEFYQPLFVVAPVACFSVSVDADINAPMIKPRDCLIIGETSSLAVLS